MSPLKDVKGYLTFVFEHCVRSVNPSNLIGKELRVSQDRLKVRDREYILNNNCYVVGFGKAVLGMAKTTEELLKTHLQKGIVSVPFGTNAECLKVIKCCEGAKNNYPDQSAENAAKMIVELVTSLKNTDLLLILISGGGSALLPYPIPPITLDEKMKLTQLMSKAGANIIEMNSIRKKISLVKGGKLAKLAYPASVVSLVLSDIIGDPLDYIASGPTIPDNSTSGIDILKKYNLVDKVPKSIIEVLCNEIQQDKKYFDNVHTYIIGNNSIALNAGIKLLKKEGYNSQIMTDKFQGNVQLVAFNIAKLATIVCQCLSGTLTKESALTRLEAIDSVIEKSATKELIENIFSKNGKICLLFGGEPSVEVKGKGLGGRNQELVLLFSKNIQTLSQNVKECENFDIILLSCGTDGIDGPTDAAGAIGYNGLTQLAKKQNLCVEEFLKNNDTYNFFTQFNNGQNLIKIGHTGTNVMDIVLLLIQKKT